ncbi:MAG: Na/Pi cotransporter family protein [Firmicutes bacterium]|nr:Na/Pi cotransporter family protein [Bacillota bacterium]
MDIFNVLTMIGGLCLFLFGMDLMGKALERRAGGKLNALLRKLTGNRWAGLLTGLGVTAIIQSSSATTVMVVGFVNSGLMTLKQSIPVIMGANIGTTVTAWILSLAGIDSHNVWIRLLKPSSFTPILSLIGIILYMFCKRNSKKDSGMILLGFATLMFGMETMSGAVSGLKNMAGFQQLFLLFTNPLLGVLAGAVLTAIIQSSSASVGILQALASTGAVSYGAAIPIIMGQNIGTCVTALISSVGANKNAKRAAVVHLSFNVLGTCVWLTAFCLVKLLLAPALLTESATLLGIAIAHSVFNVLCTLLMLPLGNLLEALAIKLVPDTKRPEEAVRLDERLLSTPPLALGQARAVTAEMAEKAVYALQSAIDCFTVYSKEKAQAIREDEDLCDELEDLLGTYLVQLSSRQLGQKESEDAAALLKVIGDFERISDHAVDLVESAEELRDKNMTLTEDALKEYAVIASAVNKVSQLALEAFQGQDISLAGRVEPLEQVIDLLKEQLRTNHILRMQEGKCTAQAGFVWSDLLTALERVSDHCSNIAGCVIDSAEHNLNVHRSLRETRRAEQYEEMFRAYAEEYAIGD